MQEGTMEKMIREYKKAREMLRGRVHELNEVLKEAELTAMEQTQVVLRRDMLVRERVELLHRIREMQSHLRA